MSSSVALSVADSIAAATLSVPTVADLHAGRSGTVATHLPGRRVVGVRLSAEAAEVHLVSRFGADLHQTAAEVRAAVTPFVTTRVDVFVEDVAAS